MELLKKYNLKGNETAVVGDSLKNDILPSLQAGIVKAFHVNTNPEGDWELRLGNKLEIPDSFKDNYFKLNSFGEILQYIDSQFVLN